MKQKRAENLCFDVLSVRGAPSRRLERGTVTHTVMRRADARLLRSVRLMALGIMKKLMKRQYL